MIDYTTVFWIAAILFFTVSFTILLLQKGPVSGLFYIQFLAGSLMFASSKIGREFLGLE